MQAALSARDFRPARPPQTAGENNMMHAWEARLDALPFAARLGSRDPALPEQISDILRDLRDSATSCRDICRALAGAFSDEDEGGVSLALDAIGAAADASGTGNAYHNPDHSRAVGVSWLNLARIHNRNAPARRIGAHAFLLGCCAAFGHDIFHDGTTNMTAGVVVPFRLERLAADFASAKLAAHGVARRDVLAVRAAILCTDVSAGYPVLAAALAKKPPPPSASLDTDAFARLADPQPQLAACLLRDADLLQSAGLRACDHDRATRAILAERGLAAQLSKHATAELLFGKVLDGRFWSDAGALFQPSLDTLRALNGLRLRGMADADADLAELALNFAGAGDEAIFPAGH